MTPRTKSILACALIVAGIVFLFLHGAGKDNTIAAVLFIGSGLFLIDAADILTLVSTLADKAMAKLPWGKHGD